MAAPDTTRAQEWSEKTYGDKNYYRNSPNDPNGQNAPGGYAKEFWDKYKAGDPATSLKDSVMNGVYNIRLAQQGVKASTYCTPVIDFSKETQAFVGSLPSNAASQAAESASAAASAPSIQNTCAPITQCLAAAAQLGGGLAQQVAAATGPFGVIGACTNVAGAVSKQIAFLYSNPAAMDAIQTTYKPNDAASSTRCQSLGDYIGSAQGKFTDSLQSITGGIGKLVGGLLSIPSAILGAVAASANALLAAITGGISSVIDSALTAVTTTVNALVGAIGAPLMAVANTVGKLISGVAAGIAKEINNVKNAISSAFSGGSKPVLIPNTDPCLKAAADQNTDPVQNQIPPEMSPEQANMQSFYPN